MGNLYKSLAQSLISVGLLSANVGWALPTLQLDILGGYYNDNKADETTYSKDAVFTLRALLNGIEPQTWGSYYISAAITPRLNQTDPPPEFGSFKINGTQYSIGNKDIYYGIPPVNVPDILPKDNLSQHGIFPTYYAELAFKFDPAQTVAAYNTDPTDGGTSSGRLYAQDFLVDISGLTAGYSVHFDLYDETVYNLAKGRKSSTSVTMTPEEAVVHFAPFSHDAQSIRSTRKVPDGGSTALLLGSAMAGVGMLRRKLFKK